MNGAGEMTSGERTSVAPDLAHEAREWQEAVILYPVYTALSREFVFEVTPCTVLETVMLGTLNDVPDHDTVEEAREWLALMDGRTQVHQLRQFLQTTSLADEQRVRALLARHLRKPIKTDADRDKIDFLLVQFFSLTAPSQLGDAEVSLEFIAQVLGPMLGPVETESNRSAEVLDEILQDARACKRLSELLHSEILERGRAAKAKAGPNYFRPASMVAFTRFSFLMRRVFFRLMHGDLNAILDGLQELERVGGDGHRLPQRAVFPEGTHWPPAHDLPVLESHVSRRVFLRSASAHARGFACCSGAGARCRRKKGRLGLRRVGNHARQASQVIPGKSRN